MRFPLPRLLASAALLAFTATQISAADWQQFRGPGSESLSADSKLPDTWTESENVAWKAELPGRGASGPIIVGDRVYVTCAEGPKEAKLSLVCLDTKSGKQLWRRSAWATGRTSTHPTSSVAAPTPASDGKRVFAFYSSNDVCCYDLDGRLQWFRGLAYDYPKAGNDVGMASSPMLVAGVLVLQVENQADSFVIGLDATTGETLWRLKRDARANWASPVVIPATTSRPATLLLQSPNSGLTAHEPRSGKTLWTYKTQCSGIPSPLAMGNQILVSSNGLTALDISGSTPELQWDASKLRPGSASPIAYGENVYTVSGGVLKCGRLKDGETLWQLRLQGKYWATPVIAGGKLYAVNQDGDANVVDLSGEKGKIVGKNKLDETVLGSPAVAGNALYIRSHKHLWKISEQ